MLIILLLSIPEKKENFFSSEVKIFFQVLLIVLFNERIVFINYFSNTTVYLCGRGHNEIDK